MAEQDIEAISDVETAKRLLQEQQRVIEGLIARIAELEAKLRRGQRQATPFSKDKRKAAPQQAGQKAGHAPAHCDHSLPDSHNGVSGFRVVASVCSRDQVAQG
jgi:hypothetical protein